MIQISASFSQDNIQISVRGVSVSSMPRIPVPFSQRRRRGNGPATTAGRQDRGLVAGAVSNRLASLFPKRPYGDTILISLLLFPLGLKVATMSEPGGGVAGRQRRDGFLDGTLAPRLVSGCPLPHQILDPTPRQLDWPEVRRVGRKLQQPAARFLDHLLDIPP